ncbi:MULTISPECIES: DUF928 domain-containing protein [unclassified Moorena]|uniref:DUF928 domain-containing protein n=1 Tax=unclassified Moorena TaxID=2683338 RepID=UPI001401933E|nr:MULTISPECIES: DUF928 domain-containing protein [unclassified Moorena]NEO15098.1 DUF928 domain-containing protein [Moorena sp. SIO3E8]NEQ01686.1 DUF928 domain-containing protein [Moorena sp. SIO3F7]
MTTQGLGFLNKPINYRLVTSCTLSLLLLFVPSAIAEYRPPDREPASDSSDTTARFTPRDREPASDSSDTTARFTPRDRKPTSDYSRTGGPRGCPGEAIPLTLLAPQTYVGQTASVHPTFAGFVSSSHEIEFRLFEFESNNTLKQLGSPIKKQTQPGVFQLSLPENHPGLTVGKKYLWQIAIRCPDGAIVERAEFRVVELPTRIKSRLSTTVNSYNKVDIYAGADFWYEAFTEALKLAQPGKMGKLGSSLVEDLTKSELEEDADKIRWLEEIVNRDK